MKRRTGLPFGVVWLSAVLMAVIVGQVRAEPGAPDVHVVSAPDLANQDGEISFSFSAGADSLTSNANTIVVNLIHEKCMGRAFQGGELEPGHAVKGPLEPSSSWWQNIAECRTDPAVAIWEVTVWRDRILQGVCKLGYMQRANGRRYVSFSGREANGSPYCPIAGRATCSVAGDGCLHEEASGTGPVRVEFSRPAASAASGGPSVPLESATISPFEGNTR